MFDIKWSYDLFYHLQNLSHYNCANIVRLVSYDKPQYYCSMIR